MIILIFVYNYYIIQWKFTKKEKKHYQPESSNQTWYFSGLTLHKFSIFYIERPAIKSFVKTGPKKTTMQLNWKWKIIIFAGVFGTNHSWPLLKRYHCNWRSNTWGSRKISETLVRFKCFCYETGLWTSAPFPQGGGGYSQAFMGPAFKNKILWRLGNARYQL